MNRLSSVAWLGLAVACGGPSVRGGTLLASDADLPPIAAGYVPADCRYGGGAPYGTGGAPPAPPLTVYLTSRRQPLVVERRPGYPPLVVSNYFEHGPELVFQVELSGSAGEVVREYRLDPAAGSGVLSVLDAWDDRELPHGRFQAVGRSWALICKLKPAPAGTAGSTSS